MIELSYWEKAFMPEKLDVCILGAGIVGLQAAIRMKELSPQLRISILDQHPIPRGASIRNAGFACVGSMTELIQDEEEKGIDELGLLVEKRWKGLRKLKEILGEKNIGYVRNPGYEIFLSGEEEVYSHCMGQLETFNNLFSDLLGIRPAFQPAPGEIETMGLRGVKHLIRQNAEGQLNPGKMMQALVNKAQSLGVELRLGWKVESWQSHKQRIELNLSGALRLSCRKLLVATNGFTPRLLPAVDLRPARNQVLLTRPIPELMLQGSFHYHQGYVYFRNVENRLLIGGARHLDEESEYTDEHAHNESIRAYLMDFLGQHLIPNPSIEYEWTGIMGVGRAKSPIIKWVDQDIFLAVRLGGMGVAIGTHVGREAAESVVAEL